MSTLDRSDSIRRQPIEPLPQPEPEPPEINITITTPIENETIIVTRLDQKIKITGTFYYYAVSTFKLTTEFYGSIYPVTILPGGKWECEIPFIRLGQNTVKIIATGRTRLGTINMPFGRNFNIKDNTKPIVTISPPTDVIKDTNILPIPESGSTLVLQGNITDIFGGIAIVKAKIFIDNLLDKEVKEVTLEDDKWKLEHFIDSKKLGSYRIEVTGIDISANEQTATITFSAIDNTGPQIYIDKPKEENNWEFEIKPVTEIILEGRTFDGQKGVKNFKILFPMVNPNPSEFSGNGALAWKSIIKLTNPLPGTYKIVFTAEDNVGNKTTMERIFFLTSRQTDLQSILSSRSYLEELLLFFTSNFKNNTNQNITLRDLEIVFQQELPKLIEINNLSAKTIMNQANIHIEILQRYLKYIKTTTPVLIGHWKLDQNTPANIAIDSTNNGNNGSITEATYQKEGKTGNALTFNRNSNVTIANNPILEIGKSGTDFSILFWLYLKEEPNENPYWKQIMQKGAQDMERTPGLWIDKENKLLYAVSVTGHTSPSEGRLSEKPLPTNEWTHIAYIKEGKKLKLYINGHFDSDYALVGTTVSNLAPLRIGKGIIYSSFIGSLDDIRIYGGAVPERILNGLIRLNLTNHSIDQDYNKYLHKSYELMLANVGTSLEEIRSLSATKNEKSRQVAERLLIDDLNKLYIEPTEYIIKLENVFGIYDPIKGLHEVQSIPKLQEWRIEFLKARWKQEDLVDKINESVPILDPDNISIDDILPPYDRVSNPAFGILFTRADSVNKIFNMFKRIILEEKESLATLRTMMKVAISSTISEFSNLLNPTLPTTDFKAQLLNIHNRVTTDFIKTFKDYYIRFEKGESIDLNLKPLFLNVYGFLFIIRIINLLENNKKLFSNEFDDIYHLLTQVSKVRINYTSWINEEKRIGIYISPDVFQISSTPKILPWRHNRNYRAYWENTILFRKNERLSVEQLIKSSIQQVESITLLNLKDSLISNFAIDANRSDTIDWISGQLLVNFNEQSSQYLTRIEQAINTIQSLYNSLRTGSFSNKYPSLLWTPGPSANVNYESLDEIWTWRSSYSKWLSYKMIYYFPENILYPNLRLEEPPIRDPRSMQFNSKFLKLVNKFKESKERIVPKKIDDILMDWYNENMDDELKGFLTSQLPGPIFTNQISDSRFSEIQSFLTKLNINDQPGDRTGYIMKNNIRHLKDIFFFIPLYVAIQLQRSGYHKDALDWYRHIYAYDMPDKGKRRIYEMLKLEKDVKDILTETPYPADWISHKLEPYALSFLRSNSFLRFIIMNITQCFIEIGDAEFAKNTGDSIINAQAAYIFAKQLIYLPELDTRNKLEIHHSQLINPLLNSIRNYVSIQIDKMRSGRALNGFSQLSNNVTSTIESNLIPLSSNKISFQYREDNLKPSQYRYKFLINRSKELANFAKQMEDSYLSALIGVDVEEYNQEKAKQDLELAEKRFSITKINTKRANEEVLLGEEQKKRVQIIEKNYDNWLSSGTNYYEEQLLQNYLSSERIQNTVIELNTVISIGNLAASAFSSYGLSLAMIPLEILKGTHSAELARVEKDIQINSFKANMERRYDEWRFEKKLSEQDLVISDRQIQIAKRGYEIALAEEDASNLQRLHTESTLDFLINKKFVNVELYEWMSGILGNVYRFFLNQATSIAKLAEQQLSFERQEQVPIIIKSDYWIVDEMPNTLNNTEKDRKGLTGSARLLQDIFTLDQFAIDTNKRKLVLSQTFSLSQLYPIEFQELRKTGIIRFATPMEVFDKRFPGHYLRLTKNVKVSISALFPPLEGISASLSNSGTSRVVINNGGTFETITIQKIPELIAFTSATHSTGTPSDQDLHLEFLLPFESNGVDTFWEFQLPKPSNNFDYDTLSDVTITIEYNALYDDIYRDQVIKRLNKKISGDLSFSIRDRDESQWFNLLNPKEITDMEPNEKRLTVKFPIDKSDFPYNIENLQVDNVVCYVIKNSNNQFELPIRLAKNEPTSSIHEVETFNGKASTRNNANTAWRNVKGDPSGIWEISFLSDTESKNIMTQNRLKNGEIDNMLLVITFSADRPKFPYEE